MTPVEPESVAASTVVLLRDVVFAEFPRE